MSDYLEFLNGFARIETKQKQIQIKFASQYELKQSN